MARLVPVDDGQEQQFWSPNAIRGRLVPVDGGSKRTVAQNAAGGAGRGIVAGLTFPLDIAALGANNNPKFGNAQFTRMPGQVAVDAARDIGIPVDYDEGSFVGRATDFVTGGLLWGGLGRAKAAKEAVRQGVTPLRAYAGQAGREVAQGTAAAAASMGVQRATEDMEDSALKSAMNFAAPMLPQLGLLGLSGAARLGFRGTDNAGLAQRADDFRAATGADPMVQQVSPDLDRVILGERGLSFTGAGALPFSKQMQAQAPKFREKVASIAGGNESRPNVGGEIAASGLFGPTGFVQRRADEVGALYDNLFNVMPGNYRLALTSTKRELDTFINRYAQDPEFEPILRDPQFLKIRKAIDAVEARGAAGPTVDTVRALRTDIGKLINNRSVIPSDKALGEFKKVYGGLSDDLKQAAYDIDSRGGTPGVVIGAFESADKGWKSYRGVVDDYLSKLEGKDVDRMYETIRNGSADQANAVMNSLTPDQRKAFSEVVINRLGLVKEKRGDIEFDVYTPNAFLNNWGNLPTRMKEALVPNATARVQLTDMAKQFDSMLQGGKIIFNTSGTTGSGMLASQIVAAISGITTMGAGLATGNENMVIAGGALAGVTGGSLAVSHWAAKHMADPKFVGWLAKANTVPSVAVPGHIARLTRIDFGSEEENATRDQLAQMLLQRFGGTPKQ